MASHSCTYKLYWALALLFLSASVTAGTVDTINVPSNTMHKQISCVIIKPSSYKKKKEHFPVTYLLHGYSGAYDNWIRKVPELQDYADQFRMIIVCPDGGFSSWYFDSPLDSSYRYETYIASELTHYIDSAYRTMPDKDHRAITGLSMGGHGALFLALRHPDIFGAAGSMSGGVDLTESKNKFHLAKRIGDTVSHAKEWHDLSVVNLIEQYTNTPVKILFDCGIKDIFILGNRHLHEKMLQLKIPHDYLERPGEHNWEYWKNALPYELMFFSRFFGVMLTR